MSVKNGRYIKNGNEYWYKNHKLHRDDDLPAVTDRYGNRRWYQNGKCHREGSPAIIDEDGTQEWHQNGKRHRKNGPAVTHSDGTKYWYVNGKLHRIDGPALIRGDGSEEWWYEGEKSSEKIVKLICKLQSEIKELTRELCDPRVQTALLYGDQETLTSNN